ncbi:type I restriction endonuclease [Thermococcus sp. ES12]|uniref:type I restriction endonuclease n=1 Tax=Thermococcus sp. ES12 TaxID=1638246 RepID=UPI001F0F1971|nr:type I restriction endonuclease [Thermococcus sp. ES12]
MGWGFHDPFLEEIERVRQLSSRISNEEATKQHLILPLLEKLGWRVNDPAEVYPEIKTRQKKRPDFVLLVDGVPVAFLEAKSARNSVIRRGKVSPTYARQLMGYCFGEGVALGILTNGVQWVLMEAFKLWTRPEERVLTMVDLRTTRLEEAANELLAFTRRNIRLYYRRFGYHLGEEPVYGFYYEF